MIIELSNITDTERLDFILRYFDIEDIGDDEFMIGIKINSEMLEDDLGLAKGLEEPFRDIIDRAITKV